MSDEFLTKEIIAELLKTRDGQREFYLRVMRERIPQGLAHIFNYLEIEVPPIEKQQEICVIMWENLFRVPVWNIIDEQDLAEQIIKSGMRNVIVEDEDFETITPKGGA